MGCELTTTTKCCMCADRRPFSEADPTYVDGRGMRNSGTRYQKYCWKCRDHWGAQDALDPLNPSTHTEQTWSFPTTTPSTSSTLSPFSGLHRRAERPHPPHGNPLRPEFNTDDPNDSAPALTPLMPQRSARRGNNRADHNLTTASNPGQGVEGQSREQPRENPFGTRAEWEAADYQSPLGLIFTRAWTRYRDAEDARRQTEAEIQDRLGRLTLNVTSQQNPLDIYQARNQQSRIDLPPHRTVVASSQLLANQIALTRQSRAALADVHFEIPQHEDSHGHPITGDTYRHRPVTPPLVRENPIDLQANRPAALSDQDMTVSIACKICYEQKMDMLLLPCHHIAACHWCVDIMRSRARNRGREYGIEILRPVRGEGWKCPTCRRQVEGTKKIFLG